MRGLKLSVKLPLLFLLTTALAAVLAVWLAVSVGSDILKAQTLAANTNSVQGYASAISLYLDNARAVLESTADLPAITDLNSAQSVDPALRGLPSSVDVSKRDVAALILEHSKVFEYVMLLRADGSVYLLEPYDLQVKSSRPDLAFTSWYQEVMSTSKTVVSDLHISTATQRPAVVIATPVFGSEGQIIGVWAGALKLEQFSQVGRGGLESGPPQRYGYVTDGRGLIIGHQTKSKHVQDQTDFSFVPPVRAALAGQQGEVQFVDPIDRVEKLAAYMPLSDTQWAVVYEVPTQVAFAPILDLARGIGLVGVGAAVLIILASVAISRQITVPLGRLATVAKAIGAGDLTRRTEVRTGDEISTLADEFNRMAGALQSRQEETEQAAESLRESEQRMRTLLESVPVGISISTPEGNVPEVNPTLWKLFGYSSREEFIKVPAAALYVDPEDRRRVIVLLEKGLARNIEMQFRRKDGTVFWAAFTSNVLKTAKGGTQFINALQDITERKQAEERQRFLDEASRILVGSLDYETTLTTIANLVVSRIADWCSVYLIGDNGELQQVALTHVDSEKIKWAKEFQRRSASGPNQNTGVMQVIQSGQATLIPEITDEMLTTLVQDGELRQIVRELGLSAAMTVPLTVHGQTLGAVSFVAAKLGRRYTSDDLELATELARRAAIAVDNARLYREAQRLNDELEQRVVERTAQLEASNKELEAFSYSVSHDLRAPLRAVDGFSRILLEEHAPQLAPEAQRYLQLVRNNTLQMGRLIDDLLTFARLSRQPLQKQTVAPVDLMRQCWQELHSEQEGRRVEISIGDLPTCQADPALLKQVWINLLANALKFTRKREVARIEVGSIPISDPRLQIADFQSEVSDTGSKIVYFVCDNGVGFEMQYADKLFGVFQRLHRASEYEGTGVGLAIVQRIIHRHGGRVWAEAQVDRGAKFYFTI